MMTLQYTGVSRVQTESQQLNGQHNRPGPHWWRVKRKVASNKKLPSVLADQFDWEESVEDEVHAQEVTLATLDCMGGTDGRGYAEERE